MTLQKLLRTSALVSAFLLIGTALSPKTALAAGSGGFQFLLNPLLVEIIQTDQDGNSAKFQEYRDLSNGLRVSLDLLGESADGNRTLDLRLRKIGRDDARYTLDYGVAGKYGFLFDFNKIPHRFGNDGTLLWSRTAPGTWEIADSTQADLQSRIEDQYAIDPSGVNFDFLNGLLTPYLEAANSIDLEVVRDRSRARFDIGDIGGLAWAVEYKHEDRRGTRPYGGSFGFSNVTEIPETIDYDTDSAELMGEWNSKRSGVRFGYRYSMFENNISTMIWDNPFRATDSTDGRAYLSPGGASVNGSTRGFADLAPDNDANLLYVSGRTKFAGNWWFNGDASLNRMSQNEELLPYTLNTSIEGIDPFMEDATFDASNPANRPATRADTDVDVTSLSASTGTTFGEDWNLLLRYRYYDYDNGSTRVPMPGYVRYHAVWEEIPRITVPYAFTNDSLLGELSWDGLARTRLAVSYKLENKDREFREVEKSDENTLKLWFDARATDRITLRGHWETGDRSIDGYEVEAQLYSFLLEEEVNNQPGLRKYQQAARDFDDYELTALFLGSEAWNLSIGITGRTEDYKEGEFGLRNDDILRYNFDLSYIPADDLNFYLYGHRADRDSFQRARQSGGTLSEDPEDDWEATMNEVNDTWGVGFTSTRLENWTFRIMGNWMKSDGDIEFFTPPAGNPSSAENIPNYEDIELLTFRFGVDYHLRENAALGVWYMYEDYTIDSFILQGLEPYLPASLLLAADNGDYKANVLGLTMKLSF